MTHRYASTGAASACDTLRNDAPALGIGHPYSTPDELSDSRLTSLQTARKMAKPRIAQLRPPKELRAAGPDSNSSQPKRLAVRVSVTRLQADGHVTARWPSGSHHITLPYDT